jgi:hypothetical protein
VQEFDAIQAKKTELKAVMAEVGFKRTIFGISNVRVHCYNCELSPLTLDLGFRRYVFQTVVVGTKRQEIATGYNDETRERSLAEISLCYFVWTFS